jgi:prephenate dehydrogenase
MSITDTVEEVIVLRGPPGFGPVVEGSALVSGAMGRPMALQILHKNGKVTVFDVDQAAVQALTDAGAEPARTPRDLAAGSDVVITCCRIRTCSGRLSSARTAWPKGCSREPS